MSANQLVIEEMKRRMRDGEVTVKVSVNFGIPFSILRHVAHEHGYAAVEGSNSHGWYTGLFHHIFERL